MKILVVEDEPSARFLIKALMGKYGEVDDAEDANVGFAKFSKAFNEKEKYDLICLDIMMPGFTGTDLLKKIREFEYKQNIDNLKQVKIIMTTALNDSKTIIKSFREQCDGYLIKPIKQKNIKKLLTKIGLLEKDE